MNNIDVDLNKIDVDSNKTEIEPEINTKIEPEIKTKIEPETEIEIPELVDICSKDISPDDIICHGNLPAYYFDKNDGKCKIFFYGGCGHSTNNKLVEHIEAAYSDFALGRRGGQRYVSKNGPYYNKFKTLEKCQKTCEQPVEVNPETNPEIKTEINLKINPNDCNLEADPGPCLAYRSRATNYKRYYFDKNDQKCKDFIFSGCRGKVY